MKTSFAITVALVYLIALASCEEAPPNDVTIDTKAENYHRGERGGIASRSHASRGHASRGHVGRGHGGGGHGGRGHGVHGH